MSATTTLYRFFDRFDRLLYVGISHRPFDRLGQHRSGKSWWTQIVRVQMEHHDSRRAAKDAESVAIHTERPLFNVAEDQRESFDREFEQSFIGLLWWLEPRLAALESLILEGEWFNWDIEIEAAISELVGWRRGHGDRLPGLSLLVDNLSGVLDEMEAAPENPGEQLLQSRAAFDSTRSYLSRYKRVEDDWDPQDGYDVEVADW